MTQQPVSPASSLKNTSTNTVCIGIDWADKEHAVHCIAPDGSSWDTSFKQSPEAIESWIAVLQERYPKASLEIAVEQSKGALINALLKYPDLQIYPVNPAQSANYRKAICNSGAKSDPVDARLLAYFLNNHRDQLRVLKPDDADTRQLGLLLEDRRRAVEQRVDLSNELTAVLKQYFPLILQLGAAKPYARFLCRLLLKWPSHSKLARVTPQRLRKFFYAENLRGDHVEQKIDRIANAIPLTEDPAIVQAGVMRVTKLARLILVLSECISQYEKQIKHLFDEHPDAAIFSSFPAAGPMTRARLLVAFSTQRERFESAEEVQRLSGIAPVTRRSGRFQSVTHRWACSKFLKQTFHEYAGMSITQCVWAKAYYTMQLDKGNRAQMAKRALAFKWIRIMFRCWQDRKPYDDARYMKALERNKSPLLKYLNS